VVEVLAEQGRHPIQREAADAGGGQLDRQRQAIQLAAERHHRLRIARVEREAGGSVRRPLDEEPDGLVAEKVDQVRSGGEREAEGWNAPDDLAVDVERLA
jgi:hypothetical protein